MTVTPGFQSSSLLRDLDRALPGQVRSRATDRVVYSHDASHFVLLPQAVAIPQSAEDVSALLRIARTHDVPLTFRSGGTSLSGQSAGTGIMADTRRGFRDIEVLDDGQRVRVQPGATLRAVNARLARYGRKLGPDPASEIACTIGGVVANNSSGMSCGTEWNTYNTIESLKFVLASGTYIDSAAPDADEKLRTLEPDLYQGLVLLRDRIRSNSASVRRIQQAFAIKNTMGYGINAFLDYSAPVDILVHLIVGSEGTLAFVSEATFRTVPARPLAATGVLLFPDLTTAADALPTLVGQGFSAIELLDSRSLKVAQQDANATPWLRELSVTNDAAFLMELEHDDAATLADLVAEAQRAVEGLGGRAFTGLQQDKVSRAALWKIRKGLYASVAGARPSGTTALLEDVAVPVGNLSQTCAALNELFVKHNYEESVIFGHARDGNIHFLINERFDTSTQRYLDFTDDLVDLILDNQGNLKAEHGTGRAMAPYVERQYGSELYDVMVTIKRLFDPSNVLNPGVIIDKTNAGHLVGLKTTSTVEEEVDRCVECGYCEPACPSKDLTLTPRQRIVLRREIAQAAAKGDAKLAADLGASVAYEVTGTCAVDSLCQVACPVSIDTGALVRRLRAESVGAVEGSLWKVAAKNWSFLARSISVVLTIAKAMPSSLPHTISKLMRRVIPGPIPMWTPDLPKGGKVRQPHIESNPEVVFFPSCMSELFGDSDGESSSDSFVALCESSGVKFLIPEGISGLCCGTPWKSKGLHAGLTVMKDQLAKALPPAALSGQIPILVDSSSCTQGLRESLTQFPQARVLGVTEYVATELLSRLPKVKKVSAIVLHPTCSDVKANSVEHLKTIAGFLADEVFVPNNVGCCGFAGDRGLSHPELTANATKAEADEVKQFVSQHADAHLCSTNKPCEVGLSRATGLNYGHLISLLEKSLAAIS